MIKTQRKKINRNRPIRYHDDGRRVIIILRRVAFVYIIILPILYTIKHMILLRYTDYTVQPYYY